MARRHLEKAWANKEGKLFIATDKNKIAVNSKEVEDELNVVMADVSPTDAEGKRLPIAGTHLTKLGVDFSAGKPIKYIKAKERLAKATVKTKWLLSCKDSESDLSKQTSA